MTMLSRVFPGPLRAAAAMRCDWLLAPWLLGGVLLGAIAIASLPAARADNAWFGCMPLWLLGMPLASLAALALANARGASHRAASFAETAVPRRRAGMAQARRHGRIAVKARLPRAA